MPRAPGRVALAALALLLAPLGARTQAAGGAAGGGASGDVPKAAKPAKREEGPPTWYAQTLTRGEGGLSVTHFWSKGSKLRAETVVAGHKVVTIVADEWYFAYDGLSKTGLGIRRDPRVVAADRPERRPFGDEFEILVSQGAEQVREENVLGRKAGVFRVTDSAGRRELWVTLDKQQLPIRLEIYDRRSSNRRVVDYMNWQSSLPIPDSFFQPDTSIDLERIELDEYVRRTIATGPVGPVPVLYAKLLYRERDE